MFGTFGAVGHSYRQSAWRESKNIERHSEWQSWLTQQAQYDLWQAEQHRKELRVEKLVA